MKFFKKKSLVDTTAQKSPSSSFAPKMGTKNLLVVLLLLLILVITIPIIKVRQELRQHADVIYSQITPEYYCLGLGGIDCNGVKTASESALGCAGLTVTKKVKLSKRYIAQNDTMVGDIVFTNNCKNTFDLQDIYIAAKDPKGSIHKFVPSGGSNILYPGQTVTIHAELAISLSDPTGDWNAFGATVDSTGKFHADNSSTVFTVVSPCTTLTETKPIVFDPNPINVPASMAATVTFKNNCQVPFNLQAVLIQGVDPSGNSYDFLTNSTPPAPVNLAPGSELVINGSRQFSASDIMGNWTGYGSYQPVESANTGVFTKSTIKPFVVKAGLPPPVATKSATPKPVTKPAVVPKLAKVTILFLFDKSTIQPQYNSKIDAVVAYMKANPTAKINVIGYADSTGTTAYNLNLSKQRTLAVQAYIVSKGIPASRMTIDWKGEANPVASNATPAGQALNRRVEIFN